MSLKFGTAGGRARINPGYNDLNALTVIQITQAIVRTLRPTGRTFNIGNDAPLSSRSFEFLAARVLHTSGVRVGLLESGVLTSLDVFDGVRNFVGGIVNDRQYGRQIYAVKYLNRKA